MTPDESHWRSLLARPPDLSPASADAWFAGIATRLLNGCRLRAGGGTYRFTEVEAYYHGPGHADPFTHRDPLQTETGRWYFHRTAGVYRSGSFKGVDITFGDGAAFGGMLVRGIEREDGLLVDGPSLTVDHLLAATGTETVGELDRAIANRPAWDAGSPLHVDWADPPADREVVRCGRVGITLRRARSAAATRFVMMPYRFLTEPRRIAKGKPLTVVGLYEAGATDPPALAARTGSPKGTIGR